jgi:hypothetical protein
MIKCGYSHRNGTLAEYDFDILIMIRRRRDAFVKAFTLLSELKLLYPKIRKQYPAKPALLGPLKALQRLLVSEILRAERKIRRIKGVLNKIDTGLEPNRASELRQHLEQYRHMAYNWRCFGDAIAFIFMDKFALKQTFFGIENTIPKQSAGFIGGKEGFAGEWRAAIELMEAGFPTLLTDLTNTIRHGDICLMLGPDPMLIEIKAGRLNKRGHRQKRSIQQLQALFSTDVAEGWRGFGKVMRVANQSDEVTYADELSECIGVAMRHGFASVSPERGLHYLVLTNSEVEISSKVGELKIESPAVFHLNQFKENRNWSPYSPYTLSISHMEALYDFIWGNIYILVLYDQNCLVSLAEKEGFLTEFNSAEPEYAFNLTRASDGSSLKMSKELFSRLAFDFTSPAWILQTAMKIIDIGDNNAFV